MVNPILGQKVYVDASVIIYATEAFHLFPNLRPRLIEPLSRGELTIVTSWISLAEVLVKPLEIGDAILELTYRQFFTPSAHLEILPVDQAIADQAAALRTRHGLKLPDAIHIATGMSAGCSHFLTSDAKWKRVGLKVIDPANL